MIVCQPNQCFKNLMLYVSTSDDKLIQWTIAWACVFSICKYGLKSWEILNLVLSGFMQVHMKVKKILKEQR